VLEVLRQRRWLGFSAFVLGMLVLCVVLARWQWTRYQERTAQNARLDAALAAPPVDVDALVDASPADPDAADLPPELAWRTVTATGTFDAAGEVAVRRRPLDGRNGFWIVTPLVTDSGVLLVNRGWTPATGDATAAPEVADPPAGPVTVTGRLRPAEQTPETDPPPAGQAWAADPEVLVTPADVARYHAYVELRGAEPDAAQGLTALADPGHRGLNNLVYSVQWLIFAVVGLFGWWRLIRQESLRAAEPAGPAEERWVEPGGPADERGAEPAGSADEVGSDRS
jgi:cytochrome oxidase assembly protein ShyY1